MDEKKVYGQIRAMVTNYLKDSDYQAIDDVSQEIATDFFDRIAKLYNPEKGKISTFVYRYVQKRIRGLIYKKPTQTVCIDNVNPNEFAVDIMSDLDYELMVEAITKAFEPSQNIERKIFVEMAQQAKVGNIVFSDIVEKFKVDDKYSISGAGIAYYVKKLRKIPQIAEAFATL